MRLHRLEMTAFGPFAQTAVVEFDALTVDGLFVLSGDTGAGKTTVLDAVAFALYGTVPGQRGDCRRLHSDHAPADVAPRVVLEATLGGRRIRLARSPEHVRPKRRGAGVRTEPARATLTWLDGRGCNLTRITEIAEEVTRLLGMSADQFFQVVLLPQGDFARFLSATNEDREVLLERLFETQRFADAETWLAARRRVSEAALAEQRHAIERLGAQVCTAAGLPDPGEYSTEWAQTVLTSARATSTDAAMALSQRRKSFAGAEAAYTEGRRIADAQARLRAARAVLDELAAAEPQRRSAADELAAARRAQDVGHAQTELQRAERYAHSAEAKARESYSRTVELAGSDAIAALSWPPQTDDADRIDTEIRSWAQELGRLREAAQDARTLSQLTAAAREQATEHDALSARHASLVGELAELPIESQELREQLHDTQVTAATAESSAATLSRAQAAVAAAQEYQECTAALVDARRKAVEARDAHLTARERVLDLRERRLTGMAAELATGLCAGQPCSVCGATEHPDPAVPGAMPVSAAAEDAAAEAESCAAAAKDGAEAAVAELERRRDLLIDRGGADDPTELRVAVETARARLRAARAAQSRVDVLRADLARTEQRATELTTATTELATRISAIAAARAATDARAAELRSRIAAVIGAADPDARIAQLKALMRCATQLRDARAAARTTLAEVQRWRDRLRERSATAGFATIDEALAAVRTAERVAAIDEQLKTAAVRRAGADAVLADRSVAAGADRESVDIAALQRDRDIASAALDEAIGACATAGERVRQLEDLTVHLWAAFDRIEPAVAEHAELARIAEIVAGRGDNIRRMSLRSYVLAARLEEVVIAASQRLRRMSGGRFEFVHTDATGPRGRRGGLGLEIRDDYTGSVRPTRTLSGGETFTASLALALGLADVVAAESGGLVLDTMFIDEGFGSLDDETLDAVMGVLDDLRAGGRVVGIVSHVDEIRQRIPNRLHVIRGRAGSRVEQLVQ